MRIIFSSVICLAMLNSCSLHPGSLRKVEKRGITVHAKNIQVELRDNAGKMVEATYLGCGGILINKDGDGILIDPFFSNQRMGRIGRSVFLGKSGKEKLRTDPRMLSVGLDAINDDTTKNVKVHAILSAHSHYDHLMDIPAVYQHYNNDPRLLLTRSGFNIIHQTIDSSDVVILENFRSTHQELSDPVIIKKQKGEIRVYPILSEHNPHFRNIKFFSGEQSNAVPDLETPFDKTKANLWLEGNTFSFLIEYVNERGEEELRVFIQSSSCSGPVGIPPAVLRSRPIDIAFVGVVSYKFSPDYPCELLSAIRPRQVVWIHWEDFFRKYTRNPKTVRGTNIPGFFEIPCVAGYKNSGKMLRPRVKMQLVY